MKNILVLGASGFIGHALCHQLYVVQSHNVTGVDIRRPIFHAYPPDPWSHFILADLRIMDQIPYLGVYDEIYQLAADKGGVAFTDTGDFDAQIYYNSNRINTNIAIKCAQDNFTGKLFFSSSACVYGAGQKNKKFHETDVPCPISSYGLEKLYAEKLYLAFARKYGFIAKIARFDTIYGLYDRYNDIRAKVIPSLCYKIYKTESNKIEIWGNGKQERAYLYIDDCIRAISLFMHNDGFSGPINICSENTMTVTQLAKKIMKIAEKPVSIVYNTDKPSGVQYRVSCNDELKCSFEWNEDVDYDIGILHVYKWIKSQC